MIKPIVSIILPVYNGSAFLSEAVSSILEQNISEIELIAINDASTDESDKILRRFSDKRIVHISNPTNIGLASTLNLGIEEAKGEFIARMDQDDIADPIRLSLQIKEFINNKNLGICGSNFYTFGAKNEYVSDYPLNHEKIFTNLLFYNCIAHPTTMFRKSTFVENSLNYNHKFDWAEDFELWTRARYLTKIINLKQPLLKYRINSNSMTASNESRVHKSVNVINKRSLLEIGINASDEILNLHLKIGHHIIDLKDTEQVEKTTNHLWNIIINNQTYKVYNELELKNVISIFWNPILQKISNDLRSNLLDTDLSKYLNSKVNVQLGLAKTNFKKTLKKLILRK
jgi:glycosyltransferase involved in cell wall biosynthesis